MAPSRIGEVQRETGLAGSGREVDELEGSIPPVRSLPGLFPGRDAGDGAGF